jgi:HEPN domain-containing protein
MHTQIDLRGPIPTCIHIIRAKQHDVGWLDKSRKAFPVLLRRVKYVDLETEKEFVLLTNNLDKFYIDSVVVDAVEEQMTHDTGITNHGIAFTIAFTIS